MVVKTDFYILYAAGTAMLIAFLLMPILVKVLQRRNLLDEGGRRKIHKGFIPSMGGIVVYMAFITSMILWLPLNIVQEFRYVIAAVSLMFVTGIRDDMAPLRPLHKLIVQCVAACLIAFVDIRIFSFYGLFGIYELPLWLSYTLTIIFIVFVTNAFNLIDGIDGLAATIATVSLGLICFWLYLIGDTTHAIPLACMVGALIGFLYYNWQPASIFMGDTGSLVVGFVLAYNTIYFIACNGALPDNNIYKFPAVFSAGFAFVLVPVFDSIRVMILRMRKGRSPFTPDRQHTHHIVLRMTGTHASTVKVIVGTFILVIAIILFASKLLPDWLLLIIIALMCYGIDRLIEVVLLKIIDHRRKTNI